MKKILSKCMAVLLAVTMVMAMSITTFAEGENAEEDNSQKGTLTIHNTVAGKRIDLYQIFSATVSGSNGTKHIAYELNSNYVKFFQSNIEGAQGKTGEELSNMAYQYISNNASENVDLVKKLLAYTDQNKIQADRSPASSDSDTEITFLKYGYYLVVPEGAVDDSTEAKDEKTESPAMLVSVTDNNATINMKSNYPTVDKEIIPKKPTTGKEITASAIINDNWESVSHMELDDETPDDEDNIAPQSEVTSEEEKGEDFDIGDTITYQLTSKVPDMTGYTSYVFKFIDTLSKGLSLDKIQSVKVGNTILEAKKSGSNTYALKYEENDDGTHTLTISFNDFYNSFKNHTGEKITVIYTATLNKDAVTGMNPNTNKAEIEYSNDPNGTGTGKSTPSEAEVYTFNFKLLKQNERKNPLSGAKFELYESKDENGKKVIDESKKISFIKETTSDNSNIYRKPEVDESGSKTTVIESAADGYAQVKGLEEGTYFLRETEAPSGYNKLTGDIKIVITAKFNDNQNDELEGFNVKYTYGTDDEQTLTVKDANDFAVIPVTNKSGTELPSTGSRGALLITLAGVVLLGVLATSSIYNKKKKTDKK